jgi:hypothetical protein
MVLPEHRVATAEGRAGGEDQVDIAATTARDEIPARADDNMEVPDAAGDVVTRDTRFQNHDESTEPVWQTESPWGQTDVEEEVTPANCYIGLSKG